MFANEKRPVPVLINARSLNHVASSSLLSLLVANAPVESLVRDSRTDDRIGSLLHPQALFVVATLTLILFGCYQFG